MVLIYIPHVCIWRRQRREERKTYFSINKRNNNIKWCHLTDRFCSKSQCWWCWHFGFTKFYSGHNSNLTDNIIIYTRHQGIIVNDKKNRILNIKFHIKWNLWIWNKKESIYQGDSKVYTTNMRISKIIIVRMWWIWQS